MCIFDILIILFFVIVIICFIAMDKRWGKPAKKIDAVIIIAMFVSSIMILVFGKMN